MKTIIRKTPCLLAILCLGCLLAQFDGTAQADPSALKARPSPDWLRSSVVYEIFPRDFSNAGDLNTVTARLDELKDLGVDILWLMPIQPVGQVMKKGTLGSPFSVRDFYAINPDYGTTNDFRRLVDQAHQRDMKVVIDIVAGQTSWDSVLMTTHPEFYEKDSKGNIIPPIPAWKDVAGLNYDNPDVRHYMIDMMKYWLTDYNVDGFRCDVAPNVPLDFWEEARAALQKVNPQVIILADAGAKPDLLTNAFDVDSSWNMNYLVGAVMNGQQPASYIGNAWKLTDERFPDGALHLRFTDNHEQTRAVARYGMNGALAAQVLMMTLDGVPMLYNGMEVGDATESGDPALFEKLPIFWSPSGRPPLRAIYHDLIKLRKHNPAFSNGTVDWLDNTANSQVVSFVRRDDNDEFLVLINFSNGEVTGSINGLDNPDDFKPISIGDQPAPVDTTLPDFKLESYSWCVFQRSLKK
ncbi:MAG TPA: alpha-amylase family glycosyl hydrolase [Candidatus Acidoferrales bacterium]|jgi:cyclomaltodextrinase|nr:alpha-amylase family glycosyl hydrolase [Candidatus Acidoferrales bacterium]